MFTDTSAPRCPPARDLDSPASDRKGVLRGSVALIRSLPRIHVVGIELIGRADRRGISMLLAAAARAIPMAFFSCTRHRLLVFRRTH
jgi:hypothetical protein